MSARQTIFDQLTILRMPALQDALEQQFVSPDYDELPFEEQLALRLDHECVHRKHNRVLRRIRQARFHQTASVQEIDFSPSRGLQRQQQVLQFTQTTWIDKGLNLIILGPTGAGKTFIGCALGHAACQFDLSVRYFRLPLFSKNSKSLKSKGLIPVSINLSRTRIC